MNKYEHCLTKPIEILTGGGQWTHVSLPYPTHRTLKELWWESAGLAALKNKIKNNEVKVYLAGPIQGMSDSQAFDWRDKATYQLSLVGIKVFDPVKERDFRGKELGGGIAAEIVEGDKADILVCDFMLANVHKTGAGTSMEILFAWTHGIPVVTALSGNVLSPWIKYHSKVVVYDVDWAVAYIIGVIEGVKNESVF